MHTLSTSTVVAALRLPVPTARCARVARVVLSGLIALGLCTGTAWAFHRDTPFLVPLTSHPGGDSARPYASRGEPKFVAFDSSSDLLGNGSAAGRQIFLFDFRIGRRVLGQVTNHPGDSRNAAVDTAGTWVAFDSNADILENGNADRNIFLWNREQDAFVQLTSGTAESTGPVMDEQGRWIVFTAGDLLKRGSVGRHVFLASLNGRCSLPASCPIQQITFLPGVNGADHPEISGDARFVFFDSDQPLVGPSNNFRQIFGFDRVSGEMFQITHGTGDSTQPSTDKSGRFVAFQSTADLLGAGSTGTQVFLLDRQDNVLKQITDVPGLNVKPSLGRNDQFLTFVSNADVLRNGSSGQHVFLYDPRSGITYQLTDKIGGESDNPFTTGNTIFFFESTEDVMHTGITGRQIYGINVFGALPNATLGSHNFNFMPGALGGGSQAELKTRNGMVNAYLGTGKLFLHFGIPNVDGETEVDADPTKVVIPPILVPSFGAICMSATGRGQGIVDCNGGLEEANQVLSHDRDTDAVDPTCTFGCREGDECWATVPVAHAGVCNNSFLNFFGDFRRGAMRIDIPVKADLSVGRGADNAFCTSDDDYRMRDVAVGPLRLTTETANTTLADTDTITGASLSSSRIGAPFECTRIKSDDLLGSRLVAVFPFFNFPIGVLPSVPGPNDMLMSLTLEATFNQPCTPGSCVPEHCTSDLDCDDDNVCNGIETCANNVCVAGTPLVCDDSNFCNGPEVCDPLTGCQAGAPPDCNDADRCTTDICDAEAGRCTHTPFTPCCVAHADCNDQSVCTGAEICQSGRCVVVPGTPLACDDGNPCTEDVCDPITGCAHNPLPDGMSCSDGNVCNGDEVCVASACIAGVALTCDDGVTCTTNNCHPFIGCYFQPIPQCCGSSADCDDQNLCNGVETCSAGTCEKGTPLVCGDGDSCNGNETCDPATGCVGAPALSCNDGASCSLDSCDPSGGCVNTYVPGCCVADSDCIDNDVCNGAEHCDAGNCITGTPVVCNDNSSCNGIETCDPTNGCVVAIPMDDFGGVMCTLNGIQEMLRNAGTTALGGAGDAKRLKRLIVGARRNLELAGRGSGRFARRLVGGVEHRMARFVRRVQGGERRGAIGHDLSQELVSLADSTRPALVRIGVNGPVP